MSAANMTYDEAVCGTAQVDAVLAATLHIEKKAHKLPGEEEMVLKLLEEWAVATRKAEKAITRIMSGAAPPSKADVKSLLSLFDNAMGDQFGALVHDDINALLDKSYTQGKRDILGPKKLPLVIAAFDKEAITWLQKHHMYWIKTFYSQKLSKNIAGIIADGMKDGLGRKAIGEMLREAFDGYKGLGIQPEAYWRGLAANGMSRSRGFGEIEAFLEAKIKHYSLINPMDERTSDICRAIVPKYQKVPVVMAVEQRDALMAASSPEDIKTIAPWPKLKDIQGKSQKALLKQNLRMPPFHGECRTGVTEG